MAEPVFSGYIQRRIGWLCGEPMADYAHVVFRSRRWVFCHLIHNKFTEILSAFRQIKNQAEYIFHVRVIYIFLESGRFEYLLFATV